MSADYPPWQGRRARGVWGAAWRRFRSDRVGMVSLAIVGAFLLLILLAALGLVAGELAAGDRAARTRRPAFIGPAPKAAAAAIAVPTGPNVDLSDVDPLAPRYEEWGPASPSTARPRRARARRCPSAPTASGRDVLAKAVKGAQISIFVGVLAGAAGHLHRHRARRASAASSAARSGDVLEWVYNVFTSIPGILLIFAFAAVCRARRAERRADPRPDRLDRHLPPGARRIHQALGARVRARRRGHRREHALAHVPPHPAQRQPRGAGAAVDPRRRLHQGRGDPVVPGAGRGRRPGVVGHDARRGAERADPRPLVAARRGDGVHGGLRHRVLAVHRCAARRARSRSCEGSSSAAQHPGPARRLSSRQDRRRRRSACRPSAAASRA